MDTNEKSTNKVTERITIWGIVQGVGFRPFVTKLAESMNIDGSIKNMGGFVELILSASKEEIHEFIKAIEVNKPSASQIVRIKREEIESANITGFSIEDSEIRNDEIGMIPADIAICDSCLEEFYNPNNPRYKHPYISCTVCGPRYTIIDSLPYDRKNTTMADFPMCEFCENQYNHKESKRYHSQTISCHDCGPMPEFLDQDNTHIITNPNDKEREKAVMATVSHINSGGVIALKGTGGYYFVCSPFDSSAVSELREIKIREEKPFAVMFKDIESIRDYCIVSNEEEELLKSSKRPIVLLEKRAKTRVPGFVEGVSRSSRYIGSFLPSLGIQYQLIERTGPLIMTSANLSDLPIIFKDDEIIKVMKNQPKLKSILFNRREIRMSLDDSVTRVIDNAPQLTRRSKGYAPIPIYVNGFEEEVHDDISKDSSFGLTKNDMIFASGGQLKSAFSLSKGSFAYISQYFGDLDSIESNSIYENNFYRMKKFFGIEPSLVICDMHPLYNPTKFAKQYVEDENKLKSQKDPIKLIEVQHHHAHTGSVMAEHGLMGPVIGVSFDGTGYGTDGNIWGGEFLICENEKFERYSHLKYVDMIGGDSSMKEGWKSAASYLYSDRQDDKKCEGTIDIESIIDYSNRRKTLSEFSQITTVESAIKNQINTIKSSSMGRLFDAVSSLLGIRHISRYEGECAISLENAAYKALKEPGVNESCDLALEFHYKVSEFILKECKAIRNDRSINQVALSGGVFQNKILMEKSLEILRDNGFEVYYNKQVPTNDGGIALGQNYIGMHHLLKYKKNNGDK